MTEKERARVILCLATITAEVTTRLHYLAQKYGLDRDELVEIFAEGLTGTTKQVAGRKVEQKEPATSISKEAGHNVCAKGIIPNP